MIKSLVAAYFFSGQHDVVIPHGQAGGGLREKVRQDGRPQAGLAQGSLLQIAQVDPRVEQIYKAVNRKKRNMTKPRFKKKSSFSLQ